MPDLRESRRAEIVTAARALIVDSGVEGLTIGRLEKQLPFTRGVITYHFDNRAEIVDAVLQSALDEIDASTEVEIGKGEAVEGVLRSKVLGFLEHPEATTLLLAFWMRSGFDARGRQVNQALFQRYRRQSAKLFDGDEAMAALLVGQVIGIVMQAHLDVAVDAERLISAAAALFGERKERILKRAPGALRRR